MRTLYAGRCKLEEHLILGFDNLKDFVKYYNREANGTLQEIGEMSINVRQALIETAWNKSNVGWMFFASCVTLHYASGLFNMFF